MLIIGLGKTSGISPANCDCAGVLPIKLTGGGGGLLYLLGGKISGL